MGHDKQKYLHYPKRRRQASLNYESSETKHNENISAINKTSHQMKKKYDKQMELPSGLEPLTSSLPRTCSAYWATVAQLKQNQLLHYIKNKNKYPHTREFKLIFKIWIVYFTKMLIRKMVKYRKFLIANSQIILT